MRLLNTIKILSSPNNSRGSFRPFTLCWSCCYWYFVWSRLPACSCQSNSNEVQKHNITHLTFNNVGSHGEGEHAEKLYQARLERPRAFAKEYGFEFVASDSNLQNVVLQNHFKSHTYSSMFAVYCLQKLYSVYYYASAGYKYSEFTLIDKPAICCGSYEMLSLPLFSTHNLRVYSEGENMSRLTKLRSIVKYAPSYKYLNVCLKDGDNCGKCENVYVLCWV